jgi:hypothetical protein
MPCKGLPHFKSSARCRSYRSALQGVADEEIARINDEAEAAVDAQIKTEIETTLNAIDTALRDRRK